jgi:hypothetical protein
MRVKKICGTIVACLLLASIASAQSSTSPQGGTAIYNGAAACVGSSFQSSSNAGLLPPPCTDGTNNGS